MVEYCRIFPTVWAICELQAPTQFLEKTGVATPQPCIPLTIDKKQVTCMAHQKSDFPRLLRLYRKRCLDNAGDSVSQERVSDELGYALSTYGQWERGLRAPQARQDLINVVNLFRSYGGIKTTAEADKLLVALGFSALHAEEAKQIGIRPADLQPELPPTTVHTYTPGAETTIYHVFDKFPDEKFSDRVRQGQQIRILTIWMPYLEMFLDSLYIALRAGAAVEILMLEPDSPVAELRSRAISAVSMPAGLLGRNRVQKGVADNIAILTEVAQALTTEQRQGLRVHFYHSLPSVLLYQVDHFCLAGFYLHGRMASHTPQLQVNTSSLLGQALQTEFETLWHSSRPIALL